MTPNLTGQSIKRLVINAVFLSYPQRLNPAVYAYAVTDEVRHACIDDLVCPWCGDHFKECHPAGRIKEVGSKIVIGVLNLIVAAPCITPYVLIVLSAHLPHFH